MVGAASDTLANQMGGDDGCCGSDTDSGGCGKCALVQINDSINPSWKVLVMKKSRCPPSSNGCGQGQAHFDLAVPGYDNLIYSTANICGQSDTYMSRDQSGVLGAWYNSCGNTADCINFCNQLPSEFQEGCKLFSSWGWTRGDPMGSYQIVDCPQAFKDYVGNQFCTDGPNYPSSTPCGNPGPGPTPAPGMTCGDKCKSTTDGQCAKTPGCTECQWCWPKGSSSSDPSADCMCTSDGPAPGPTPAPSGGCCSWDGGHTCGGTTDYCNESKANCEGDCNGQWINKVEAEERFSILDAFKKLEQKWEKVAPVARLIKRVLP